MDGLQAIKERILEEAKIQAEQILNQGQERAAVIRREGEAEAAQIIQTGKKQADLAMETKMQRAESMAQMQVRQTALRTRQAMIGQVMTQAVQQLSAWPPERKKQLYIQMITAVDDPHSRGEILFCKSDQDIAADVVAAFKDRYQVADRWGSFSGGIIVRKGRVEDNLSFELIIDNNRSDLVQAAAEVLFASQSQGRDDDEVNS